MSYGSGHILRMVLLAIFVGGGVGSVVRYLLGAFVNQQTGWQFPTGTLVVNVLGCLAIGFLAKLFLHAQTEQLTRAALIVGFCGGFTTFSTFSYETLGLINGGRWMAAGAYIALSLQGPGARPPTAHSDPIPHRDAAFAVLSRGGAK